MVEKSPAVSLTMERSHDSFLEDGSQESNLTKRSRTGLSVAVMRQEAWLL